MVPVDLRLVAFAVLATVVAVFASDVRESPVRVVVGLVFVLFVPGYASVAAPFPERGTASPNGDGQA